MLYCFNKNMGKGNTGKHKPRFDLVYLLMKKPVNVLLLYRKTKTRTEPYRANGVETRFKVCSCFKDDMKTPLSDKFDDFAKVQIDLMMFALILNYSSKHSFSDIIFFIKKEYLDIAYILLSTNNTGNSKMLTYSKMFCAKIDGK